jgi:hypothetical protein
MAWLWLSGLMTTNEQKRACLEMVLTANPENVYARAGLTRLQNPSQTEAEVMEARLAFVTSDSDSAPAARDPATARTARPLLKQLKSPRPYNGDGKRQTSETLAAGESAEPARAARPSLPNPTPASTLNPAEPTCPACDEPVSSSAKMCPYCFMPFHSIEELLGSGNRAAPPTSASASRRKRKGILGYLGFTVSS